MVRSGVDRLAAGEYESLAGKKVALLGHAPSLTSELMPTAAVLRELGAKLITLFTPEHGYFGTAQDMIPVQPHAEDGMRVVSLYGETAAQLAPKKSDFEQVDVLVIDIQDVGARFYTYIWSAALCLRVAARCGVQVCVLDRPNPLGGEVVEGFRQGGVYRSFVGMYPLPIRHGMTAAELLLFARQFDGLDDVALDVVEMEGYQRSMFYDETGLPWVMPSPNMPSLSTALVYPGGCLIEGTTLSEGRGTTRPFEIWGSPHLADVEFEKVPGASLRPLRFLPTFQKFAGKECFGVQVHVTDRTKFRSVRAYARWIRQALLASDEFSWRTEVYEYEKDRPAIDLLTGGPEYRQLVNDGAALDEWLERADEDSAAFLEERKAFLIYE